MEPVKMSQKEYLRKYLSEKGSGERKKKKKKKSHKFGMKTVKIIDDDDEIDAKSMRPLQEGEFEIFNATEDAPQIAGVIDERGPVDFADKRRWKIIADDGEGNVACGEAPESRWIDNGGAKSRDGSESSRLGDSSSPRERRAAPDGDLSPPRRRKARDSSSRAEENPRRGERRSMKSERSDYKSSPAVKKRGSGRASSESDQSPPRRRRREKIASRNGDNDSDIDPPRRSGKEEGRDRDPSSKLQARRTNETRGRRDEKRQREDKSPRRSRWNEDGPRCASGSPVSRSSRDSRMKKTLDGKRAGLQDARALRIETEAHKRREARMFEQMSAEVSGFGKATVLRDRRTGRKRDLAAEASERREKEQRQAEIDEKYAKWGRGLKQVDEQAEKRRRDLYEMSKPLARYANDADLDRELREVEREGDTMLEEIKKRRIKDGKRESDTPSYQGAYAPNRFGIRPGHRWDGVDRSNGYEKKWFEARNARKAIAEEAYKWSTADM